MFIGYIIFDLLIGSAAYRKLLQLLKTGEGDEKSANQARMQAFTIYGVLTGEKKTGRRRRRGVQKAKSWTWRRPRGQEAIYWAASQHLPPGLTTSEAQNSNQTELGACKLLSGGGINLHQQAGLSFEVRTRAAAPLEWEAWRALPGIDRW